MVRTQIILPSSGVVDMYEDVNVSYNFNAADIREPEKGVADFTKTIVVPGTKNNHILFHNQFDINLDSVWDTRKKISCAIVTDDVEVMRGYMRLMKIIQRGNNEYDYEVTVIGNTASLFKDVGGDEMTVLNLARLDHVYNKTNIVASWSATVGEGYLYPMMDNGNFQPNSNAFMVSHWLPAIYVKEYIDRIFEYYGYQYSSAFFTSNFFKRLIIPLNSDMLRYNAAEITSREFRVSRETSVQTITQPDLIDGALAYLDFNNDSTSPNVNPGGLYSLASDRFTVVEAGFYSFVLDTTFGVTISTEGLRITTFLDVYDINGNFKFDAQAYSGDITSNSTIHLIIQTQGVELAVGDYVDASIIVRTTGNDSPTQSLTITLNTGSYFKNKVSNIEISVDDTVYANSIIPEKTKISDFLAGIKKMFNLYFSIDKDITNKYIIEPRDDWYSSDIVDWSAKLDISKDVETIPMGDLDSKRYIFQYKKDEDYYNSLYQDKFQENYGTYKKTIETDFVKNDYTIEPLFSNSPLHSDTVSDRVYVKLRKKDGTAPTAPANLIKTNIRILYYGGLKSCSVGWEFPKGTALLYTYPFAGHLDDPITPSIDLCYGIPKEVYYRAVQLGASYTNNNLYNLYWRNLIEEISDKNSRIVNAYFNLTPADINQLDARKIYYFKENHWRLNKVIDYNPLDNSTTKCEFTKIKTSETGFN